MTGDGADADPPEDPVRADPANPTDGFSLPRRTSGWTPVLTAITAIRQFFLPVIVVIAFNSDDRLDGLISGLGAVGILTGSRLVAWLRQRWWIDGDRLRVRSGLLRIDDRTIPLERIQRIDRSQTLLSRILSLYELRAETAGGGGAEISLEYLTEADADAIERWAEGRIRGVSSGDESEASRLLVETSTRDLVIAGATANRIGALAVAIGTIFQFYDDVTADGFDLLERWFPRLAEDITTSTAVAIGTVVVVVALAIGWLTSIVATVMRFFEFRLTDDDGELRTSHGMLSRYSATSPRHRIQAVRVTQPLLRRLLGYATVSAETAGSPGDEGSGTGTLTPIARRTTAFDLVSDVGGPMRSDIESLHPVSRHTIRRGIARVLLALGIPAVAAAIALFVLESALWPIPPVATLIVAVAYGPARYRALGYRVTDDHVVARSGVLTRRWWSVPLAKVQTVAVRSSPFQRRMGLASVSVDTAGGRSRIEIVDLPVADAVAVTRLLVDRSTAGLALDAV